MSIFKKTLSCAVLAALSTCALAGCGKQDAANETAATSSEAPSAAITETISESTTAPEQTSVPETVEAQPAETEPPSSEALSVDASTPYGQHGALHVENGKLTDENGNTVQLYGMSTHGIAWFPSISIMIPSVPCGTTGIPTVSASPCIQRNTAVIVPAVIKNS